MRIIYFNYLINLYEKIVNLNKSKTIKYVKAVKAKVKKLVKKKLQYRLNI